MPLVVHPRSNRRLLAAVVTAVEPEGDMGVEQKAIARRSTSRPGSTSRAGAMRSTPSRTRTEPRCAPNREPARVSCSSRRRMAKAAASVLLPPANNRRTVDVVHHQVDRWKIISKNC